VACGYVIGFRFHLGIVNIIGFVVLVLLIGAALAIIGDLIGVASGFWVATAPMMLIPQLTLGLASVGLQPVERFPDWIQGFVRNQPLSQW
ncbi:antibiotic transporter, partial [Mycobacterium sp. ITM-2017-0098]